MFKRIYIIVLIEIISITGLLIVQFKINKRAGKYEVNHKSKVDIKEDELNHEICLSNSHNLLKLNETKLAECVLNKFFSLSNDGSVIFNDNHNISECTYSFVEWHENDFNFTIRNTNTKIQNGSKLNLEKEFHYLSCELNNTFKYNASFARIFNPKRSALKKQKPINILLVGFDSISRLDFMDYLPLSSNYLINHMKSNVLTRYNIVGDGTPAALIPLLTSYHEHELPNTIKNTNNSNYVDLAYPMIWSNFSDLLNYSTLFLEDRPDIGVFNYRMNGFSKPPVDHYARPSMLADLKRFAHCTNRNTNLKYFLDYVRDFIRIYKKNGFFGLSFIKRYSHDDYSRLKLSDTELFEFLNEFYLDKSVSENTILVVFSDHGPRFSSTRQSIKGLLSERSPFFSIFTPSLFKFRYSKEYKNFMKNINKLTTPMDIHKTLKHVLQLEYNSLKKERINLIDYDTRSISLFNEIIPNNRTCRSAGIDIHWCSCLKRRLINLNSLDYQLKFNLFKMISYFLEYLNEKILGKHLDVCATLSLYKVNRVYQLESYLANATYNQRTQEIIYGYKQYFFQITTLPNNGSYEFTMGMEYEMKNRYKMSNITLNKRTISRINKYGNQANCIIKKIPDLRKFCFCK